MSMLIAGEQPALMERLRRTLAAMGHDCPASAVLATDQAMKTLASGFEEPEILFFVASPESGGASEPLGRIRTLTTARIVAVGPAFEPHAVLESLRAGADYYIDENDPLEQQIVRAMTRRATAATTNSAGRLITVVAATGGAGATLLSVNLAVALAQLGSKIGLFDFATGFGSLADHLNLEPRHTLDDVLRKIDLLDGEVLSQSFTPHTSGVSVLAAGADPEELELTGAESLDQVIRVGRHVLGTCVVDLDRHAARRCHALQSSDAIVVVFRPDFASLCGTRRLLDDWDRRQLDRSRVLLVANRCGQDVEIPIRKAESILREKVSLCIPDDSVLAGVSVNCGNPALLESPHSRLSSAIRKLALMLTPDAQRRAEAEPVAGGDPLGAATRWLRRAAGMVFC